MITNAKRRPKITRDEQPAIEEAIKLIRRARRLLRDAGATKAADRLTRALKPAEGAMRHAERFVPIPFGNIVDGDMVIMPSGEIVTISGFERTGKNTYSAPHNPGDG